MIQQNDIFINGNDYIELYIIGYQSKGESIVINIANQFVGIIDSYYVADNFITKDIVENIGKKLNFVCWTHTDKDHTKGLYDLLSYVTPNTAFILPDGISCQEIKHSIGGASPTDEYAKLFNYIHAIQPKYFVAANEHVRIYEFNLRVLGSSEKYKVSINSFAPMSLLVRNNVLKSLDDIVTKNGKLHETPNLHSVGLKVIITGENKESIRLCLAGDLDNATVEQMDDFSVEHVFAYNDILKIPHHGSKNCDLLMKNGYVRNFGHAAVTSFRGRCQLPDADLLNCYKKIGTVSYTSQNDGHPFGMVKYRLPISFLCGTIMVDYQNAAGQA